MKPFLLIAAALCSTQLLTAQTKTYDLQVVAEGNFGTPNGDVFKVARTSTLTKLTSGALYQTANGTAGVDVLQDFDIFGNRAVLCGKGSNTLKLAIAEYPSFDSVKTFTGIGGVQCLGKASNTKGYLSMATGNSIQMLDLASNTLTPVSDPSSVISSYASYMVQANGYMYVSIGSKIVKIDTLSNAALPTAILPGIGTIGGMVYDDANSCIWLLGKVSGTSVLVRMEPANGDNLNAPVTLTGITNAAQLRLAVNKLYFLSGKNVHAYSISSPVIPTPVLYTSNLSGNTFSFAYGKSFAVDPLTGDFALASATNFNSPSIYEIVDGATFQVIDTGSVAGKIANELFLRTYTMPVPDASSLQDIYVQCAATLTPPTATAGNLSITGTTDSLEYNQQGSYTVTWTFVNGYDTATQMQNVIVQDTIAPVASSAVLPDLNVNCPYTLIPPTATDNCTGIVTGTTDSLTYTAAGTYTVQWTYSDGHGNSTTQAQALVVNCATGIGEPDGKPIFALYPNPAQNVLIVELNDPLHQKKGYSIVVRNLPGQQVLQVPVASAKNRIDLTQYGSGLYYISLLKDGKQAGPAQKIIIRK